MHFNNNYIQESNFIYLSQSSSDKNHLLAVLSDLFDVKSNLNQFFFLNKNLRYRS